LESKIKVNGYKKKELNNEIQKINEELKEFERKFELSDNYFREKIIEIIPFIIETKRRVTNLKEYIIKLEEYFSNYKD
jgi:hypothetical protein